MPRKNQIIAVVIKQYATGLTEPASAWAGITLPISALTRMSEALTRRSITSGEPGMKDNSRPRRMSQASSSPPK
ncbi:MAG: hypothetical protein IPL01_21855 [Acidobacteria bacterium]|nr:hypothetical protein [Acidobacteriota bacterium]